MATRPIGIVILGLGWLTLGLPGPVAAQPSAKQALGLEPMQADVPYEKPDAQRAELCRVQAKVEGKQRAWVVLDPQGRTLRRFVDTNGDNKIDQWCYYQHGSEVYRDIDADFDEKADQYRWLGIAGTRWGLDPDEDGVIDTWQWISAEEVGMELVAAIRERDVRRLRRLLLSDQEIVTLQLTAPFKERLQRLADEAVQQFARFAAAQRKIGPKSQWVDFSAPLPAAVATSAGFASRDLIVYQGSLAVVRTGESHDELAVGPMVQVGRAWRLIGLPGPATDNLFFHGSDTGLDARSGTPGTPAERSPELQPLVDRLQALDGELARATTADALARIYAQRADLLGELTSKSTGTERDVWLAQWVESVIAAHQTADPAEAVRALSELESQLKKLSGDADLLAQVRFALISARYAQSLQNPKADYAAIQSEWTETLEKFAKQFTNTSAGIEALLQLAIAHEFAGQEREAKQAYQSIVERQPASDVGRKAAGAIRRLNLVGQPIELRSRDLNGRPVDLAQSRGAWTVVHFWATWCEPCKQDMQALNRLSKSYPNKKFTVIGVNLDDDPAAAKQYVAAQRFKWPQLHSEGGLDSPLATQLGIFTLPVMILVGPDGTVVNRSLTVEELQRELANRLGKR